MEKIEKNNRAIAPNVFTLKEKKCILLMFQNITQIVKTSYSFNDSEWRRMALSCSKKSIRIVRGIKSKNCGDFYCLNCLHPSSTENKRESYQKVCKNKDFKIAKFAKL